MKDEGFRSAKRPYRMVARADAAVATANRVLDVALLLFTERSYRRLVARAHLLAAPALHRRGRLGGGDRAAGGLSKGDTERTLVEVIDNLEGEL